MVPWLNQAVLFLKLFFSASPRILTGSFEMRNLGALLFSVLFLASCDAHDGKIACKVQIDGLLEAEHVSQIENIPIGGCLKIKSGGGDGKIALEIAELVQERDIEIIIEQYCASACFDIIALSASRVSILPNSVIAVHDSPVLLETLAEIQGIDFSKYCTLPETSRRLRVLITHRGDLDGYYETAIRKLGFSLIDPKGVVHPTTGCAPFILNQDADMWLLDSQDLARLGIKTKHKLCIENETCLSRLSSGSGKCVTRSEEFSCPLGGP